MTEEPATNMVDEVQNIAGGLTGAGNNEAEEEEKNDEAEEDHEKNDEEEDNEAEHQLNKTNEEEEEGALEKLNGAVANKLITNEEEEEEKAESHKSEVAVSEPKTASESGSRRPRRTKNKPTNQNIDVVIPDLPFAPQPKDPNIIHYIFEYEDEGTKRQTTRRGNAFTSRSNYQSVSPRGSAPDNGGSLYDNSPYFQKPFSIYKVPVLPRTIRPNNKALTSRSRSTDRNMSSTQRSNYSNSSSMASGYGNQSNRLSYSKRYATRPPPPSNYVERTKEFEERQRRYNTEFTERYKMAHPLPLYQKSHQKTVLEIKIEQQKREEMRYKKVAQEARKKRIKNRKIHEEFIKKTENFENEGEEKPKYLDNMDQKPNYLDLDFDLSEEDENEKQKSRTGSKQSSKTHNTENQSEKGKLEGELDETANGLLGNTEKKNNEEEEEEEKKEKKGEEEEEANDDEKKGEEEEKKEEEEEKNEDN